MVMWGVVFGALLGALWPGHDLFGKFVFGAVLGGIAGATLRSAIRSEVESALKATRRAVPAPPPQEAVTVPTPLPASTRAPAPRPQVQEPPERPKSGIPGASRPLPPRPPDALTVLAARARGWLFGGNTVVRMGIVVLFAGLAFLAKYAMDNALLPPELRLAGIACAAIALFVTGFRLRGKEGGKAGYGLSLQGAGVAVLYLTVFAAFRLYQLIPAGAAFTALALVCAFSAVIAVLQNAQSMAFIGFAGGFAAPILASTGQGSHVALFSYYLVLGAFIAALAWVRAWRSLNLLGFLATYGVATAWGALQYRPEFLASTEPFLLAFFAVYLAAGLAHALRHSLEARRAVDATLLFGVPLATICLQAVLVRDIPHATAASAIAFGALYLALGWWVIRRPGQAEVHRWLAECFLALGLGFTSAAVPLALDAQWTSAVWALEGAAVYWMGRRQDRWLARAAGLLLQVLAALAFLDSRAFFGPATDAVVNPIFLGSATLALAAFTVSWFSRERLPAPHGTWRSAFASFETGASPFVFWAGFLWLQFGLHAQASASVGDTGARLHLAMCAWVVSAFALHFFATTGRQERWPVAATPAFTVLPVLFAFAVEGAAALPHVFVSGGWIAWPAVVVLHLVMLRRLDSGAPRSWWPVVHAGGVWLLVLLAGNVLTFAVGQAGLWGSSWASVILLVASTLVLLALSLPAWFRPTGAAARHWPLDRFRHAYLWVAAAPVAALTAAGSLLVAATSSGEARPLPYVPLLNPTDLAVALGILACMLWFTRLRASDIGVPAELRAQGWMGVLGAIAFVAINTAWLRVAHHFAGVPWNARALFDSFLVQAGYSILWTLLAFALMVSGNRRGARTAWMAGAVLLGATVLKLFVIDLSNRGGAERIVVFIAVGVLMLAVGYFAPIPPAPRPSRGAAA